MTFFITSFRLGIGGCDNGRGHEAPFPRGSRGILSQKKVGNAISSILGIKMSAVDDESRQERIYG